MALGTVNNDYKQHIWGAAAQGNQQVAALGRQGGNFNFKDALEEAKEEGATSFGFGSQDSDGGLTSSISAMLGASDDMLSQLQFSLLKNNASATGNDVNGRMSQTLL